MTTTYTYDDRCISDLHKDAYGFRPGERFWMEWNSVGDDRRQAIWDDLCETLDRELALEEERKVQAIARFERSVADTMELGAQTRQDAIRWLAQGLFIELAESATMWDYEDLDWAFGVPFGYTAKAMED